MKKPILTLVISFITVLAVGLGSIFLLFAYQRAFTEFRYPAAKHVLVIGNSLGQTALNDTILPAWRNACKEGAFFALLAPALERQLAANPQIDTVCIACGVPSFVVFKDESSAPGGLQRTMNWFRYMAFADAPALRDHLLKRPQFFPALLLGMTKVKDLISRAPLGGFKYLTSQRLQTQVNELEDSLRRRGSNVYPYEEICRESSVQVKGLQRLIAICERHKVQPVLVSTPVWNYDRYYADDGYRRLVGTLSPRLLVADYHNFAFPDTTAHGDAHHLNHNGAALFSQHIAQHGLHTVSARAFAAGAR